MKGSDQPKKINTNASRALAQFICQDSFISTRILSTRLSLIGLDISYRTIGRHLVEIEYHKNLLRTILILTENYKCKHIE